MRRSRVLHDPAPRYLVGDPEWSESGPAAAAAGVLPLSALMVRGESQLWQPGTGLTHNMNRPGFDGGSDDTEGSLSWDRRGIPMGCASGP